MRNPRFLSNIGEAIERIPLEEPDHWIKLPEEDSPQSARLSGYRGMKQARNRLVDEELRGYLARPNATDVAE